MPYFSPSLVGTPFAGIAKRLADDIATAEPRLRAIAEDRASRPVAPGKWSPKQILGHLIDSASNNHQRFVRAQLVEELRDPGYAQEGWVASQRYAERRWVDLVDLWCAYNRHLVHVIGAIPESRRDVPLAIGGDAPVTLSFVALDYVGHIQHHLNQMFAPADA
jgi:hypothetical protein